MPMFHLCDLRKMKRRDNDPECWPQSIACGAAQEQQHPQRVEECGKGEMFQADGPMAVVAEFSRDVLVVLACFEKCGQARISAAPADGRRY